MGIKNSLLVTSAMISASVGTIAQAQTTPSGNASDNDIIVTARRVEERLSDVPISIQVFTQAQIAERNLTDLSQLATYTPSLQANSRFGSSHATFAIRGFVQEGVTAPSVGIYFADVIALRAASSFQSGDGAGPSSLFDLQNVQVLKGPQGTLFGRNTTGGAVLLVPQKPTSAFEGYVEGSVGNFDMKRLQAVVNVPLGDRARLRLGMDRMTRDGTLNNIGLGPRDLNDIDYVALRGSFVVDLTPNLENYTIVSYLRSNTNGVTQKLTECNPTFVSGGVPYGALSCDQIAREGGLNNFYTVSSSFDRTRANIESFQIINTTTWRATDNLTIKNIASYGEQKDNVRQDAFGTRWIIQSAVDPRFIGQTITFSGSVDAAGRNVSHQYTYTEELQFQGSAFADHLDWQAGLYFERSGPLDDLVGSGGPNTLVCTSLVPASGNCARPYTGRGTLSSFLSRTNYKDYAAYAQGTWKFSDTLRVTAGIRYTVDESNAYASIKTFAFDGAGTLTGTTCVNSSTTLAQDCVVTPNQKTQAPTWVVNVDYHPHPDVLFYSKYARGYRQGSVNAQALAPNEKFDAEKLDMYELGTKGSWRGPVPGSLNVAAFYNDFKNQQFNIPFQQIPTLGSLTSSAVVTGARSEIYGVEVDGNIRPFTGFELSGGYAYLYTELKAQLPVVPPTGYTVRTVVGVGQPLLLTPKHKWNLTGSYTLPFIPDTVGKVRLGVTYAFTGSFFAQIPAVGQPARAKLESFGIWNANFDWKDVGGAPIDLSVFVTNLTKQKYFSYAADVYTSFGFVSKTPGEPRVIGARLRMRFGP